MQFLIRYILFVSLLGFGSSIKAQDPVVQRLSKISNLPDVEFYDILEDKDHYIWLAADKGLYRYNGKRYKKFTNSNQKVNSLFQLKLDDKGRVWSINLYGQIFYVENDTLTLFYDANKLVKGQLSPFEITDTSIRLFTIDGVYDIDFKSKKVIQLFQGMSVSESSYNGVSYVIKTDSDGTSLQENQKWYQIQNDSLKLLTELTSKYSIQSPRVYAFKHSAILTFKVQSKNQIYFYTTQTEEVLKFETPKSLEDLTIYNIKSINNDYWFLTTSGVFVFQLKAQQLHFKEQLFINESVTDVVVDFNKNYWFTTLDNGVFVSSNFNIIRYNLDSSKDKITAACALDNNQFLLGTNSSKLLFYNDNKVYKTIKLPGSKIIGNLFFDASQNHVIVSINASESYTLDLQTFTLKDQKNKYSVAKTFSKIDDQNIFYGSYKEAIIYNQPYTSDSIQIIRKSRVKTSKVLNDNLFVSFIDGLYQFDINTFTSKEIKLKDESILVNSIEKINDELWLATQHHGLLSFKDDQLFSKQDIVPQQVQINTLKSDGDFLWISTDDGFYRFQPKTNQIKCLNTQDGLTFSVDKFIILDDYLVAIFPNSFYVMPKNDTLFKAFKTSKVWIESVTINDKDTIVNADYNLPHNFNNLRFDFNSNGFRSNKHVSFKYRLKPIDTTWRDVPLNTHFVVFNSLSSGKYTFELQGKNSSSNNKQFASPITFTIHKPFWETYWFYALILIIVVGFLWLYFRWRLEQKEEQRIAEIDKILIDKKITNLRLENLRSQMNPHFIFNALNSIQDYIVSNEKDLASSYLVKFSRLIRMYLDYSQQNEITLQEELNALQLYLELEKVRFEDELTYNLNVDKALHTNQIKVPSLFIQPYVENALKHGLLHKSGKRLLQVEAKKTNKNKLLITIEDNGIGRKHSEALKRSDKLHKPFATKANEERVRLYKNKLKRDIDIEIIDLYSSNQQPIGTKVVITMPIQ
ncbi:histidine kinase [Marixanthomonas sp. SCSIO 43207]|uniref:sensor histidine kinase n=1 Tax=Marixanthomonas sp. SCSIO 43207 TaxID=2779360 RepID=UPI001CA93781|nr:histidine kinase [Marixanthomonas sp. SCSIO 43207]UAB80080.1 histidine kinase [Marixanthomonas sp. SCSIO 43207]